MEEIQVRNSVLERMLFEGGGVSTKGQTKAQKQTANAEKKWIKKSSEMLSDLSTSNGDIVKLISEAAGSKGSEAKLQLVTTLLGQRSNKALAVSQVLKELFETMKRMIGNI